MVALTGSTASRKRAKVFWRAPIATGPLGAMSEDFVARMAAEYQQSLHSRSMCLAIWSWRICVVPS